MKPYKTNHLANKVEKMHAANAIPSKLLTYFAMQEELTYLLHQSLAEFIDESAVTSCQVVRFFNGELIVTTSSLTLANHLRYLEQQLLESLKTKPALHTLNKLSIVQLS